LRGNAYKNTQLVRELQPQFAPRTPISLVSRLARCVCSQRSPPFLCRSLLNRNFHLLNTNTVALACTGALLVVAAAAASPLPGTSMPAATAFFSVNDGALTTELLIPSEAQNGDAAYDRVFIAPNGAWTITYDLNADAKADPRSLLAGTITVENSSALPATFTIGVDIPICPGISAGSVVGGIAVLTLDAIGGGSVSCINQTPMVRAAADGAAVGSFFTCPANIMTSGDGTMTVFGNFGTPIPSANGPATIDAVGARQEFTLTAGDSVKVQFSYIYEAANTPLPAPCPGDLNHDGQVNSLDLVRLLDSWGSTVVCPDELNGDINGDGVVDSADLAELISMWELCSGE